jgi:hypothetical protein
MTSGAELDEIEHAILSSSVVALRKRAQAQREKAAAAKPGEAYIANRLAAVLMSPTI